MRWICVVYTVNLIRLPIPIIHIFIFLWVNVILTLVFLLAQTARQFPPVIKPLQGVIYNHIICSGTDDRVLNVQNGEYLLLHPGIFISSVLQYSRYTVSR